MRDLIRPAPRDPNAATEPIGRPSCGAQGRDVPTVTELTADGYQVEVVFWNHAAAELKHAATKFISLDKHLDHLRL